MRIYYTKIICIATIVSFLVSTQDIFSQISEEEKIYKKILLKASEDGDIDDVNIILEQGYSPNINDRQGVTPLMYAAQNGHTEIVKALLNYNADVFVKSKNGITALHAAVRTKRHKIIKIIAQYKGTVLIKDKHGATPLHYAAIIDDSDILQTLIDAGSKVNETDNKGNTPLLVAAEYGNLKNIQLLTLYGAKVDIANNNGITPLMMSANSGNEDIFDILNTEKNSATISKQGYSLLQYAVNGKNIQIVKKVYKIDTSRNHVSGAGITPLLISRINNSNDIKRFLRNNGARFNPYPVFLTAHAGAQTLWSADNFAIGAFVGAYESKYGLMFDIAYLTEPTYKRVLVEAGNNTFFQYRERKNIFQVGMAKDFTIFRSKFWAPLKLFVGVNGVYGFGKYRGISSKPDSEFYLSPKAGIHYKGKIAGIKIEYNYLDYKDNLSENKFSISIYAPFYINKNRIKKERIKWQKMIKN